MQTNWQVSVQPRNKTVTHNSPGPVHTSLKPELPDNTPKFQMQFSLELSVQQETLVGACMIA